MSDHLGSHSDRERVGRTLYAAWLLHVQQETDIDVWSAVAAWYALTFRCIPHADRSRRCPFRPPALARDVRTHDGNVMLGVDDYPW